VSGDALRSLAVSQRLLGTKEVVVIHHTKCGMDGLGALSHSLSSPSPASHKQDHDQQDRFM